MTVKELSDYLNMPISSIYSMTHKGQIPYLKISQRLRFDSSQIQDWLALKTHNSKEAKSDA